MPPIDWTNQSNSVYICNGATKKPIVQREAHDYYATDPKALELLLDVETFSPYIWEPACGGGHLSETLKSHGYNVRSSDIIDRGYPDTEILDFLKADRSDCDWLRDIITNPPYKYAQEFVEKSLELSDTGGKVAMFLKLTFLEGQKRKLLFESQPPKTVYVSSSRLKCGYGGDMGRYKGSAVAYAWYVWEKGYSGDTVLKWIN